MSRSEDGAGVGRQSPGCEADEFVRPLVFSPFSLVLPNVLAEIALAIRGPLRLDAESFRVSGSDIGPMFKVAEQLRLDKGANVA